MDEFDASTVETEEREATRGRGAEPAPQKPVPAAVAVPRSGPVPQEPASGHEPDIVADDWPHARHPNLQVTILPAIVIAPAERPTAGMSISLTEPRLAANQLPSAAPLLQVAAEAALPPAVTKPWAPRLWRWTRRAVKFGALAFGIWFTAVMASIALFRSVDPPTSNLMLLQRMSGEVVVQKWLPIERIPAQVIRAIIVSEDGRFCQHGGIDLKAIEAAIETAKDGTPRGASTITMQVAKNLYLWPSKSYVRKALEVPITLAIEAMWSKRRIFEVYANIAEWGPGVFGVEAAAGYHFGKSVGRVSEREAALLAVALPNPVTRDAGDPGPGTERLANTIQSRMRAESRAATCIERTIGKTSMPSA